MNIHVIQGQHLSSHERWTFGFLTHFLSFLFFQQYSTVVASGGLIDIDEHFMMNTVDLFLHIFFHTSLSLLLMFLKVIMHGVACVI